MQSWDGLSLELLKHGFRQIAYFELSCPTCGDWRSAVETLTELHPCPRCGQLSPTAFLAEGYTRRESIPWELASQPLPDNCKGEWSGDATSQREYRMPISGRPPNPETQPKIVLCAFLALRGATRQAMAEQIGVKAGTATVFCFRNKTAIERERERLRLLPEDARRYEAERARSQIGRGTASKPSQSAVAQPGGAVNSLACT